MHSIPYAPVILRTNVNGKRKKSLDPPLFISDKTTSQGVG